MKRLKDYEEDCDKKGVTIEKYGHLDKVAEEEQSKIVQLNKDLTDVERAIKDCQGQYKEILKREIEEL